jgi:hypothetical protein
MHQRVLLATFSIRPHHATTEALSPPFPHFDPFGTEFREPGRISHPNTFILPIGNCRLPIEEVAGSSLPIGNWQSEIGNYKDPSSFRRSS